MATSSDSERASGLAVIGVTTSSTNKAAPSRATPHIVYTYGHRSSDNGSSTTQRLSDTNGADDRHTTISTAEVIRT